MTYFYLILFGITLLWGCCVLAIHGWIKAQSRMMDFLDNIRDNEGLSDEEFCIAFWLVQYQIQLKWRHILFKPNFVTPKPIMGIQKHLTERSQ